jgi:glucosamine-6-phosphate deaminase
MGANPHGVHLPPNSAAHGACEKYEATIKSLAPVDIWIVGIGQNGHIGFNEPAEKRFSRTREVTLHPETLVANRHHFNDASTQPTQAITVGLQTLMENTQSIALIASGAHKHKPLAQLLSGSYSHRNPATTLQFHPEVTVYADTAAMGNLKGWGIQNTPCK